jgi:hypothetical protein
MELSELVQELKPYNAVLVTGPQRSGTTIGARILAQELGYRYVDENAFGIHDPHRAYMLMKEGNVVLQAPALCHVASDFTHRLHYAVVMMRRPIEDITKSENRIGWRVAYNGLNLLAEQKKYAEKFGIYGNHIALIKYYCWDMLQKQMCDSFDLEYESLRGHPLWKEERPDFAPRQFA